MLTQTAQDTATPPAYTWVDDAKTSAIAAEWIGDATYSNGKYVTNHLYALILQSRHGGRGKALGKIQQTPNGWIITAIALSPLPAGESLVYATWQKAQAELYNHHLEVRRAQVRATYA